MSIKIISNSTLSVFILRHRLNGLGNKNICSLQKLVRAKELAAGKYKRFYEYFPNLAILTKSATPSKVQ